MQEKANRYPFLEISASPGIVIGKACASQDILLLVERRDLEEGRAEFSVLTGL
jgi:hypothetical protein